MVVARQVGSSLNSPEFKKYSKKAFSLAEALIALLVGSLILGMSAPLITKQLKHNTFTDIQARLLNREIENVSNDVDNNTNRITTNTQNITTISNNLRQLTQIVENMGEELNYSSDISSLKDRMIDLENATKPKDYSSDISNLNNIKVDKTTYEQKIKELESQINPTGIVKFFVSSCPTGWSNIGYDGHYVRITTNSQTSYAVNSTIGPSLPNITGGFPGIGEFFDGITPETYYSEDTNKDGLYGALYRKNTTKYTSYGVRVGNGGDREDYFGFDASKSNKVYGAFKDNEKTTAINEANEILPRAVHLVACKKN